MEYQIKYAFLSHMGNVRKNNEDNFWCVDTCLPVENHGTEGIKTGLEKISEKPVFGVFDGMGGECCGEVAAYLSAESCGKWYREHKQSPVKEEKFWLDLCQEMNRAVCDYAKENKIGTMGSTAAILAFDQGIAYACNLGDSRIYELRDNELEMISTDHVFHNNLFGKAPLLQYAGIPEDHMALEPGFAKREIKSGIRYLICSDGVTDMLSDPEIRTLMMGDKEPEEIIEEICDRSLKEGGRDNITIVLCEVTEEKSWWKNWLGKYKK